MPTRVCIASEKPLTSRSAPAFWTVTTSKNRFTRSGALQWSNASVRIRMKSHPEVHRHAGEDPALDHLHGVGAVRREHRREHQRSQDEQRQHNHWLQQGPERDEVHEDLDRDGTDQRHQADRDRIDEHDPEIATLEAEQLAEPSYRPALVRDATG